jgi:hypothetical protein
MIMTDERDETIADGAEPLDVDADRATIRRIVSEELSATVSRYRDRAKYFAAGLGTLIVLISAIGVFAGKDFFRALHNEAFPVVSPSHVAISYEGFLELTGSDPNSASRSVYFYSTENQRVEMYARLNHRFESSDAEKRKVVVAVDGNSITEDPVSSIEGGFRNITSHLKWGPDLSRQPNVHDLVFSLDDSQPPDSRAEVSVVVVILVYGSES